MIELKSQINFRISSGCNISLAVTHIASTVEEAESAGEQDAFLVTAYLKGYGNAGEGLSE